MKSKPFVSCIMPTYNRREFVPHAIRYFLRQDYPKKELIILDDGDDCIEDLIPINKHIRYYKLDKKITLGEKLNIACEYTKGSIIINWDDDDWYASCRISYQVNELIKHGTDLCGINNLLYYDFENKLAHNYIYPENQKLWLIGSSLCYTKSLWEKHRFKHINVGMDGLFVWSIHPSRITALNNNAIAVHMIHPNNVSPKQTSGSWWHTYSQQKLRSIMGPDWDIYQNEFRKPVSQQARIISKQQGHSRVLKPPNAYQNIYACLVHEKKECIIDLVRNLHYHDPDSKIILYNGGENHLLSNTFNYEVFNAWVHPSPKPQKHGYLHGFALDCMKFALKNFTFDTFTIVDSDQLGIQSGYTQFLTDTLPSIDKIGLLSSDPNRIPPNNRTNFVALQAHREYELWKPFITKFKNGANHFVHWTFWPGTIFTKYAVNDIVKLFKTNKILADIMKQSNIWATEEVIFPTITKLLGYEVISNPCDTTYVKYKVNFNINDVNRALRNRNAFWIHPVERSYDNPLRKHIREHFNHYSKLNGNHSDTCINQDFSFLNLLAVSRQIKGWLSDHEADLLVTATLAICSKSKDAIVEIGCYHGKATVLIAETVNNFGNGNKVYAIDPHDGVLGAKDKQLQHVEPSYNAFIKNIRQNSLTHVVRDIKDYSYKVNWNKPISFLYIDGLHDYPSVARDYYHYSDYLTPCSFVGFHDYADYYPGVMAFVSELLQRNEFSVYKHVDSLIILRRKK